MKKEYLFLLDSYCFIWKKQDKIVLYNTLSKRGYTYMCDTALSEFVDRLISKDNLYCISVSCNELANEAIAGFINSVRNNFCGDLLPQNSSSGKPIVVVPEININEDVDRNLNDINSSAVFGSTILKNLTDIYLELGGKCSYGCDNCQSICNQINWCYSMEQMMSFDIVNKIFHEIKYANVFDIHFMGGNILEYIYWPDLISLIRDSESYNCKINIYINIKHLQDIGYKSKINELMTLSNIVFNIHMDASDITENMQECVLMVKDKAEFICKISNEYQFNYVSNLFEALGITAKILPFYTGDNLDFFENYVFQDEKDILNPNLNKKDIFSHQHVNTNYFGKLYIKTNGDVCSNVNSEPIGTCHETILKSVYQELKTGTFWRKTRDKVEPCNTCIYKYLCPSPSNYEIAIGKANLCRLK